MAQRLALALVYTFGSGTPGVQSLCLTALCVVYCNLHLVAKPFANKYTHALQVGLHSSCSVGHAIFLDADLIPYPSQERGEV